MGNTYGNISGPDVISDKSIKVEKIGVDAELWYGYKKTYKKDIFQQDVFDPPHTVTNPTTGEKVEILCRCRDMIKMMSDGRGSGFRPSLIFGDAIWDKILYHKISPACWEDAISDLSGESMYKISYKDPQFYVLATNPTGLAGQSTPKLRTHVTLGKTSFTFGGARRSRKTRKLRKRLKSNRRR